MSETPGVTWSAVIGVVECRLLHGGAALWPGVVAVQVDPMFPDEVPAHAFDLIHVTPVNGRLTFVEPPGARRGATLRPPGFVAASFDWDDPDKPAITYNALGEGRVWVTDANGEIGLGDYLTTSAVPGYGERQDDDLLHSYTVAKCTQSVDWAAVADTLDHDGRIVKRALVACTYHCG